MTVATTVLAGRSGEVRIGDDQPFAIIGERINPTGRKSFAEELRGGDLSTVTADAIAQTEAGADMLDVNAGIPLVDEADLLQQMLRTLLLEHGELHAENDKLRLLVQRLTRHQFGRRSEQLSPDQLQLGLGAPAPPPRVDQRPVRELGLRVLVERLVVRVRGGGVEVEVALLHVLAVISFRAGQAK